MVPSTTRMPANERRGHQFLAGCIRVGPIRLRKHGNESLKEKRRMPLKDVLLGCVLSSAPSGKQWQCRWHKISIPDCHHDRSQRPNPDSEKSCSESDKCRHWWCQKLQMRLDTCLRPDSDLSQTFLATSEWRESREHDRIPV
jgi:hypothetical protein